MRNDDIEVKPGQVWADQQTGQEGRSVEVLALIPDTDLVRVITRTPNAFSKSIDDGRHAIGRKTNLAAATLRRNYALVTEAPEEPDWDAGSRQMAEALFAGALADQYLSALQKNLADQGGACTVSFDAQEWLCALVFGREAPDSDMAGGAAYGTGETLSEALRAALDQTGWLEK